VMTEAQWTRLTIHAVIITAGLACVPLVDVALAANGGYDGVYRGDVTRTRGDDSICGKATFPASYSVVNGQFSIVYDASHHVGVTIEVQTDGSLSGNQRYVVGTRQAQVIAKGRIAGNVLDVDVDGLACAHHYHLTKTS
jgi:hypothetical protein